jgi:hypothetical protein
MNSHTVLDCSGDTFSKTSWKLESIVMSVTVATFSFNNQFMAVYWRIVFQNKKFETKYSLKKKVFSFGDFFPKKHHCPWCTKEYAPKIFSETTIVCPHNLCPKAWACITYKWARGKLFYSTGKLVKSFI